jgi:cobalt-zinc-cadmium efflux system outer membrane protein
MRFDPWLGGIVSALRKSLTPIILHEECGPTRVNQSKLGNLGIVVKALPLAILGFAYLAIAGCAHRPACDLQLDSALAPHAAQFPADERSIESAAPTSFDELLELATRQHPDLRAARARVEAAQGLLVQAGLYPNPVVGAHFKEIGHRDNALGEVGVSVAQAVVRGGKLQLAQEAAADAVTAADWQALTRWFEVVTRLRLAYIDLLGAQRERDTLQEMTRVAQDIHQAAQTLEKTGAGNRPDVLRAKVELEQQALRKSVADRAVESARRVVAATVGVPAVDLSKLGGDLNDTPPAYDLGALIERTLSLSAEVQEARTVVAQREKLLRRAEAEVVPDVTLELLPFYASQDRQWRGDIAVAAGVPIFNKNEGNIHAARAELARARAEEQAVALRLRERLATAFQRYQAAQLQADAYSKRILPDARESLRLVEVGYRGGDAKYSYTVLLQAQQVLFQAQLAHVQALGEWHRAAALLAGLAQIRD